MNAKENKKVSKFLSLILRHKPETINLILDGNGWADIDELIEKSKTRGFQLSQKAIEEVVITNDKQRFSFNESRNKIRANQGHSIKVDLNYVTIEPPEYLYHGTVHKFMSAIRKSGLQKMKRHHVHLSHEQETASKVGQRRGKPVILTIRSGEMYRNAHQFFLSENGVWLTDHVPSKYIEN